MPFFVGAQTMTAVGRAAQGMVEEVRRQFREIPGLLEGKEGVKPDSARCVDISTTAALKEMIIPGVASVLAPGDRRQVLRREGARRPARRRDGDGRDDGAVHGQRRRRVGQRQEGIEGGLHGGKGSDPHKAAVVGDTVGDPFKDTSGPAMNILIKLMSVVSLVLAPWFPRGDQPGARPLRPRRRGEAAGARPQDGARRRQGGRRPSSRCWSGWSPRWPRGAPPAPWRSTTEERSCCAPSTCSPPSRCSTSPTWRRTTSPRATTSTCARSARRWRRAASRRRSSPSPARSSRSWRSCPTRSAPSSSARSGWRSRGSTG
jgi:hypothetical protein